MSRHQSHHGRRTRHAVPGLHGVDGRRHGRVARRRQQLQERLLDRVEADPDDVGRQGHARVEQGLPDEQELPHRVDPGSDTPSVDSGSDLDICAFCADDIQYFIYIKCVQWWDMYG